MTIKRTRRKRGGVGNTEEQSKRAKKNWSNLKYGKMVGVVEEFMKKNDDFLTKMEDNCIEWFDSEDGKKFKKTLDDEIMKMQGKERTGTEEEKKQQKFEFDIMVKMLDNLTPDPTLSKEDQEDKLLDVCDEIKGQGILYTKREGGKRRRRRKSTKKKKRRRRRKSTKKKKRRRRKKSRK